MEDASKSFTAQLILVESEIANATHRLEKMFTSGNAASLKGGTKEQQPSSTSSAVVNPIKLIRRLTALEMSLNTLKKDCEMIQNKRTSIVQSTLQLQQENVTNVRKIFEQIQERPLEQKQDDDDEEEAEFDENIFGDEDDFNDGQSAHDKKKNNKKNINIAAEWEDLSNRLQGQLQLLGDVDGAGEN